MYLYAYITNTCTFDHDSQYDFKDILNNITHACNDYLVVCLVENILYYTHSCILYASTLKLFKVLNWYAHIMIFDIIKVCYLLNKTCNYMITNPYVFPTKEAVKHQEELILKTV